MLLHQAVGGALGGGVEGLDVEVAELRAVGAGDADVADDLVAAGHDAGPEPGAVGAHVVVLHHHLDLRVGGAGIDQARLAQVRLDDPVRLCDPLMIVPALVGERIRIHLVHRRAVRLVHGAGGGAGGE